MRNSFPGGKCSPRTVQLSSSFDSTSDSVPPAHHQGRAAQYRLPEIVTVEHTAAVKGDRHQVGCVMPKLVGKIKRYDFCGGKIAKILPFAQYATADGIAPKLLQFGRNGKTGRQAECDGLQLRGICLQTAQCIHTIGFGQRGAKCSHIVRSGGGVASRKIQMLDTTWFCLFGDRCEQPKRIVD